ncbi:MAG: lysophospholipid acyltransferase family protein [Aggregatilineales bacterium]
MGELLSEVEEFIKKQPIYNRRRRLLMPIFRGVMNALYKVNVNGLANIPTDGPTLIISNHLSFFDPGISTAVIPDRYVISMSKAEAINNPVVRMVVALWGNYYIKRGEVDRRALLSTIELVKSGQLVWIAPEGTRNPSLQDPKDGVAYIASKADATIVPMSIIGAGTLGENLRRLRRAEVHVNIGIPFKFVSMGKRVTREMRALMMTEAMYRIAMTIPETYAHLRGSFGDLSQATFSTLQFINSPNNALSSINSEPTNQQKDDHANPVY